MTTKQHVARFAKAFGLGFSMAVLAACGGGGSPNLEDGAKATQPSFTSSQEVLVQAAAPGSVVYQAQAIDTAGGQVTYALKPGVGDAALFTIDPTTGSVIATQDVGSSSDAALSFTVVATTAQGVTAEQVVNVAPRAAESASSNVGNETAFRIANVVFVDSTVKFDLAVRSAAVESFFLVIRFDKAEVPPIADAVSVQSPAPGWLIVPNVTAGEVIVAGVTANETLLEAGQVALAVEMQLADSSDRSVAITVSGSFNADESEIPAFTRVLTP